MIRIGLVDCTTSHADAFSKIFNVQKKFRGFKVTKCWDVKAKRAREVADLYGLEAVKSLSDMTGIDAVMLVVAADQGVSCVQAGHQAAPRWRANRAPRVIVR